MNFLYKMFSEDLIYALGWTVLHSFWQAMVIGLLMAVGMMFLQQKSAKARYEMAAFSLFLVFVSSLTTFLVYYETAQAATDFITVDLQGMSTATAIAGVTGMATSTLEGYLEYFNQHIPMVVAVWFLGVCFFLLRLVGGLTYIQRLKYTKNKPVSEEWNARVTQLCKRLRLRKTVKLVESSLATVPMVIGYLKPVILMPLGAINNLSESEVDAILAHELAHVYRNDFLLNIFLSIIEVLFYFNPAVWWIAANIRTERENCCDDIAIKLCGNSLAYAKALLSLQELSKTVPGYAMAFAGPKNQLLHRIKRILSQPRTKSNMLEKFTATCLLMVTMVLFSIGANSYNYNKKIQQQYFANEMTALMEAEQGEEEGYFDFTAKNDTTPKGKKQRYIKKSDDGEVELEIEDGGFSKLLIDGEEIPASELGKYNDLIDDLIDEMESVPGLNQSTVTNNSLNTQTSVFDHRHKKTITTETEDNGQTRIVIQSNGEEPTEIILNDGQEFIFIDGTRFEAGDTAVIIDEKSKISMIGEEEDFINLHKSLSLQNIAAIDKAIAEANVSIDISIEEVIEEQIAEMEERLQELKIRQEEVHLQSQQIREENIQEHKRRMNESKESMAKYKEQMATQRNSMELEAVVMREHSMMELEEANEHLHQIEIEEMGAIRFNDQIKNTLVQEMLNDGLIESENNYSFELAKNYFKVNGKKQSAAVAKKYLKLYEKGSGHKMNSNGQIKHKNKNGVSKSSFRSSSYFNLEDFQRYSYFFLVEPETFRMNFNTPKRIDGLRTLPFQIRLIEIKPNFIKYCT
ncbi:MAG: bla regulator protein BlaR1 [Patescibacteria group bacterium]|jgi:bla regulator protein BlaR1